MNLFKNFFFISLCLIFPLIAFATPQFVSFDYDAEYNIGDQLYKIDFNEVSVNYEELNEFSSHEYVEPLFASENGNISSSSSSTDEKISEQNLTEHYLPYSIKGRISAFFPSSHRMEDIYGNCWAQYSVEFDYRFFYHWGGFLNLDYYHRHGHSIGMRDSTSVSVFPMTVGINYYFGRSKIWLPYFGVGIGAVYVHFKDCSGYVQKHPRSWGFATYYQLGTEINLNKHFFLDLFNAYRWNAISFHRKKGIIKNNVQTGGWEIGGGIGVRF